MGGWYLIIGKGTQLFSTGGYKEEFNRLNQTEESKRQLDAGNRTMMQSVIDTNKSVQTLNTLTARNLRTQRTFAIVTLIVAGLSLVAISFSAYYAKKGVTSSDIESLRQQLQNSTSVLDSMRRFQRGIDSSLKKAVKDSFYVRKK
jgi:hypothetical protein